MLKYLMYDKIQLFFTNFIGLSASTQKSILSTIVILITLFILSKIIIHIIFKQINDLKIRYRWKKIVSYFALAINFILIANVWVSGVDSIVTYLGLVSAGIAIALKDIVANFAGWIFIVIMRPFEAGDRIQIGKDKGDVIDIRLFQFTILEIGNWVDSEQSTGRIIHIPNSMIFRKPQVNYNKGFQYIWNEIPVLLTFESNWQKGKKILQKILNKQDTNISESAKKKVIQAAKKFLIFYSKLTPIVYTTVKENGILITGRYLCLPQKRRDSEEIIWEEILNEFKKNKNINFAYPTTRLFMTKDKPLRRRTTKKK